MGEVLPFTGRFFAVRDWTASERAQIQTLARQLKAQATGVEVVYGSSDAGDPWCVIKDGEENVLIHVARIGGGVVIHDMVADLVREGRDLWFALGRAISDDDAPLSHEVVFDDPALERRNAQLVVALVTATAFGLDPEAVFGHPSAEAQAPGAPLVSEEPSAPPQDLVAMRHAPEATADDRLASDPTLAAMDMAVAHVNPIDEAPPAPKAPIDQPQELHAAAVPPPPAEAANLEMAAPERIAPPEQPKIITGTDGADTLQGSAAAEVIRGGAGNDVISGGGAPSGQVDVLEGGSGDDQIAVDSEVVASGGSGADTFVVAPPATSGAASANLGVIIDFSELDGDKVRIDTAHKATITSITQVDNILADVSASPTLNGASPIPGERVGVDVNGDGVEDGYVLVAVTSGRIALGAPERGGALADGHPEHTYYASEVLSIGASIWIHSDVI